MQPPPRGNASSDEVVERIRAWAKRPTAEATLAICDELRILGAPEVRGNHVDVLAKAIMQRHAKSAPVLISLGRLQLAIGKLADAQQTIVTAGRIDPDLRTPYRLLGEVLLRRGDAIRAERMLARCIELDRVTGEVIEDRTEEWLRRAHGLKHLQEQQGEGAVAADIARDLQTGGRFSRSSSISSIGGGSRPSLRAPAPVASPTDDQETQVGAIPDGLRKKWKPETNKFDEVLDDLETSERPAYEPPRGQPLAPPPGPLPPPGAPAPLPPPSAPPARGLSSLPPPVPAPPPKAEPRASASSPKARPGTAPSPSRQPQQPFGRSPSAIGALAAPIPAVRGPAMVMKSQPPPAAHIARPAAQRPDASNMSTLPVPEGDMIEASEHPTLQRDPRDDDAIDRIPAPPRASDDASPAPAPRPGAGAPANALKAEAVTFGDDELKTLLGGQRTSARAPSPFPAARPGPSHSAPYASGAAAAYSSPSRERDLPSSPFAASSSFAAPAPAKAKSSYLPSGNSGAAGETLEQPWDTTKVLDALVDAGIYERDALAASPAAWMNRRDITRPRRRGSVALYIILFTLVAGGIGGGIYYGQRVKAQHVAEAADKVALAEGEVRKGGLESLGTAEIALGRAFELDSRTLPGARVWLEDRVLRSYMWPSEGRTEGGLASAIERGKTVGLAEGDMAFARIALALSSNDTVGAAAIAKALDPGSATGKDHAWTELTVGWVLERAGDARAVERYSHAAALDPDLVPARLYLAKLAAITGDIDRVNALTKDVAADLVPTRDDLVALATLIKGNTEGVAVKPGAESAMRPNGFGWIVPALVVSDAKAPPEKRKEAAERAVQSADSPADLTRIGRLAAAAGDEMQASRAALRALEISPIFSPARALAARLALLVGRPDDAARALEGAPAEAEINALRAWLSYERGDLNGIAAAFSDAQIVDKTVFDRKDLESIVRPLRFALAMAQRPSGPLKAAESKELADIGALGELGPLVAFDVALDAGDIKGAGTIATGWKSDAAANVDARPSRALRLARLARLEGKGEDADRLSKIAVEQATVVPRALVERVLVLCALGKGADALALLNRFQLLATDEQPWLRAYATAQAGKTADAKKMVAELTAPDRKTATWFVRRDALLALAAGDDEKRAKPMAKDMLHERPGDPDVQAVAKSLGVK